MGRRYYCEYCDKTFIDDLDARKKHLQSSHHIKLRSLHYEHHRDPKVILKEEILKTPCRRFMTNGSCQFAGMCKYTHYTLEELWEIKQQIEYYENCKEDLRIPTVESWLQEYCDKHNKKSNDILHIPWTYPESLEHRPDLPPSLKKFQPEHFFDNNFEEWEISSI